MLQLAVLLLCGSSLFTGYLAGNIWPARRWQQDEDQLVIEWERDDNPLILDWLKREIRVRGGGNGVDEDGSGPEA